VGDSDAIWKRLVSDPKKKIPVWWEMKNSYKEDMETFIKMIEDEDDIKDSKETHDREVKVYS
jgi:hypothetical protein